MGQFDRIVGEWKGKVDGIGMDLDNSQKETRIASAQLFQVKSAYEEGVLQLDEVRRENKTLSNEIKDIMDQIGEGGRSIHEIDKIRKRLEAEKMEPLSRRRTRSSVPSLNLPRSGRRSRDVLPKR